MSQAPSEDGSSSQPNPRDAPPDTYFEDATEEWEDLEEQQEELSLRQEALRRLDERVAKIDRDIGIASLTIDATGTVHVKTSTPDMAGEVKQLVHGHSWPQESEIGYDADLKCVTWSLKTNIDSLVDDYRQQITE